MTLPNDVALDVHQLGKRYRLSPEGARHPLLASLFPPAAPRGREFWALRDVCFRVRVGEALGIIGSNGAGKSTLLKILSRITEPTTGRAEIRGRVASLLEVGTGFHPELNGRENVYLNGAILGMRKAEIDRKLDEIVAFADIGPFLDTPIKRYSSGMRVRLAFAVAAHLDPEILIVDEVLAVGDAAFQKKCLGKMGDVARGGRTVLFVSHNLSAVQRLCSRALLLSQGRLIADDTPAEAVAAHLSSGDGLRGPAGDVTLLPRPGEGLGEQVRLVRAELLDAAGLPTSQLRFGEPFSVRIEARSDSVFKDLSLVLGIEAPDETRIATASSEESGSFFDVSPGSPLRAEAAFAELALQPGSYSLTLSVRHGQRRLDQVLSFLRFRVSEVCAPGVEPPVVIFGYLSARAAWRGVRGIAS